MSRRPSKLNKVKAKSKMKKTKKNKKMYDPITISNNEKDGYEYYVGLDMSLTSTGIAILSSNKIELTYNIVTNNSQFDSRIARLKFIVDDVFRVLSDYPSENTVVTIEHYAMHLFNSAYNLAELGGILRYLLYLKGYTYIEAPPTTIKKFVTNKGNAKKEDVKLALYKNYGVDFEGEVNDISDSFAVAIYGYHYVTGNKFIIKETKM